MKVTHSYNNSQVTRQDTETTEAYQPRNTINDCN
jgi:hypothetical protein